MAERRFYPHTEADLERFWSHVNKTETCWLWTGGTIGKGYGGFRLGDGMVRAHRFIWHATTGRVIPPGMMIRHTCDVRPCVRLDHLIDGTHLQNMEDRQERGNTAKGEKNGQAKLTEADVIAIRSDRRSLIKLANHYGVARSLVQRIRQGKAWAHV